MVPQVGQDRPEPGIGRQPPAIRPEGPGQPRRPDDRPVEAPHELNAAPRIVEQGAARGPEIANRGQAGRGDDGPKPVVKKPGR